MKYFSLRNLLLSSIVAILGAFNAHAVPCGPSAEKDIVILIDITASQTAQSIAAQKTAALSFVNTFASYAVKPNIAIATFNSACNCTNSPGSIDVCDSENPPIDCYNPPSGYSEARVVTSLSTSYSAAISQLSPSGGIVGQGTGGNGKGGSNLKKALEVAQAHLASSGNPNYANQIVLMSDGQANFPGYYLFPASCPPNDMIVFYEGDPTPYSVCTLCSSNPAYCSNICCVPAQNQAATAAQTVRSTGTTIFTALSSTPSANGASVLQNQIASHPSYHFSSPAGIAQIIPLLTTQLPPCNDGLSCTSDSCVANQCVFTPIDSDGDGVSNCSDGCPNDPLKTSPGACGCGVPDTDSDGDGIPNCLDQCNGNNALIGQACDGSDSDTCASGVWQCPSGGSLTCSDGPALDDSDGDGVPNCIDQCNGNNALIGQACDGADADPCASGVWQCPSGGSLSCSDNPAVDDSDGDGSANCIDQCPSDPLKVVPGVCGCGTADTDSDVDGTPNCADQCASDPNKTAPGACGCGIADTDSNSNGIADCNEVTPAAQCSSTDVQGYINALSTTVDEQYGQVRRLTRRVTLVRARCRSTTAANAFVRTTNRNAAKLRSANRSEIAKLPASTLSCPSSLGCANSVIPFASSQYTKNSSSFRALVDSALAYELTCREPGGVCNGTARECADRAAERERIRRSERSQARRLNSANKTTVSQLPTTTAVCS